MDFRTERLRFIWWKNVDPRFALAWGEIRRLSATETVVLAAKKLCGVVTTCEIWANSSGVRAIIALTSRRINMLK
jgi:hypothetical protein